MKAKALALFGLWLLAVPTAAQQSLSAWSDIINSRPDITLQAALVARGGDYPWTAHRLEDGYGDVNLDFHSVTISALPRVDGVVDAVSLLKHIRVNFADFFSSDRASLHYMDEADRILWDSSSAQGAVMSFDLRFKSENVDWGSVVTSRSEPMFWRFHTLWTPLRDFNHPVAGAREFGVIANADGTYTFYTRAADRASGMLFYLFGSRVTAGLNRLLDLAGIDGDPVPMIFTEGDRVWSDLMKNLAVYVNENSGTAVVNPPDIRRLPWDQVDRFFKPATPWAHDYVAVPVSVDDRTDVDLASVVDNKYAGTWHDRPGPGFVWIDADRNLKSDETELIPLGSSGGVVSVRGFGADGVVIGSISDSQGGWPRAHVWTPEGEPIELSFPGSVGGEITAFAEPYHYAGYYLVETDENPDYTTKSIAFIWDDSDLDNAISDGEVIIIDFAVPVASATASSINENGMVAGVVQYAYNDYRIFRWEAADGISQSEKFEFAEVTALDEKGTAYGKIFEGDRTIGFRFDGHFAELPTLGGRRAEPLAVNENGLLVGISTDERRNRLAAMWDDGNPVDLSARTMKLPAPCHAAYTISTRGIIACWYQRGEGTGTALLIPFP